MRLVNLKIVSAVLHEVHPIIKFLVYLKLNLIKRKLRTMLTRLIVISFVAVIGAQNYAPIPGARIPQNINVR